MLDKAIKIALGNGWDCFGWEPALVSWSMRKSDDALRVKVRFGTKPPSIQTFIYSENDIIFNIDFAKALFGDEFYSYKCTTLAKDGEQACIKGECYEFSWQYHLKELAVSPDRLKYLSDYLEGRT